MRKNIKQFQPGDVLTAEDLNSIVETINGVTEEANAFSANYYDYKELDSDYLDLNITNKWKITSVDSISGKYISYHVDTTNSEIWAKTEEKWAHALRIPKPCAELEGETIYLYIALHCPDVKFEFNEGSWLPVLYINHLRIELNDSDHADTMLPLCLYCENFTNDFGYNAPGLCLPWDKSHLYKIRCVKDSFTHKYIWKETTIAASAYYSYVLPKNELTYNQFYLNLRKDEFYKYIECVKQLHYTIDKVLPANVKYVTFVYPVMFLMLGQLGNADKFVKYLDIRFIDLINDQNIDGTSNKTVTKEIFGGQGTITFTIGTDYGAENVRIVADNWDFSPNEKYYIVYGFEEDGNGTTAEIGEETKYFPKEAQTGDYCRFTLFNGPTDYIPQNDMDYVLYQYFIDTVIHGNELTPTSTALNATTNLLNRLEIGICNMNAGALEVKTNASGEVISDYYFATTATQVIPTSSLQKDIMPGFVQHRLVDIIGTSATVINNGMLEQQFIFAIAAPYSQMSFKSSSIEDIYPQEDIINVDIQFDNNFTNTDVKKPLIGTILDDDGGSLQGIIKYENLGCTLIPFSKTDGFTIESIKQYNDFGALVKENCREFGHNGFFKFPDMPTQDYLDNLSNAEFGVYLDNIRYGSAGTGGSVSHGLNFEGASLILRDMAFLQINYGIRCNPTMKSIRAIRINIPDWAITEANSAAYGLVKALRAKITLTYASGFTYSYYIYLYLSKAESVVEPEHGVLNSYDNLLSAIDQKKLVDIDTIIANAAGISDVVKEHYPELFN